jgi:hypothetical protein
VGGTRWTESVCRLFKSTNFYLCRYLNSVYLNGIHSKGANYPTKHNIQI